MSLRTERWGWAWRTHSAPTTNGIKSFSLEGFEMKPIVGRKGGKREERKEGLNTNKF